MGPVVVLLKYIALYKQLFLMFSLYCLFTSKKVDQDRLFFTSYIILLHEILAEIVPNKCLMSSWVMLTLKTSHQLFKKKKKKETILNLWCHRQVREVRKYWETDSLVWFQGFWPLNLFFVKMNSIFELAYMCFQA